MTSTGKSIRKQKVWVREHVYPNKTPPLLLLTFNKTKDNTRKGRMNKTKDKRIRVGVRVEVRVRVRVSS
jgi:hypothetical protein